MLQYLGLKSINGSLVILDGVSEASFEEMVEFILEDGSRRTGRIVQIEGSRVLIQVFEGAHGISLTNTRTRLLGHPVEIPLSPELLGRTFNGAGKPLDGLGEVYAKERADINGRPLNPVTRVYPRNYIQTGLSGIDGLSTLIRGQKLPIFSGAGLQHNRMAAQIVRQARLAEAGSDAANGERFGIVFAAMGVKNDVADYFRRAFEAAEVMQRAVMFLNLSNDPIIERILTPRCALTVAEYLAFELDMHILVILTDLTSYCEALREFASSKGEIPGRKGFPGYLYSDLASLYERAGIVEGRKGSITQLPILTMPNDDITHPIPDLTGYITEGQIVLDRYLDNTGIYPPISVLPSLSRLMKDGIGEGFTREDHAPLANQLFASYARVQDVRALASVIGEEELMEHDRLYIEFGKAFEKRYLSQSFHDNRAILQTLDLGWEILSLLPREDLDRIDDAMLAKYYPGSKS
ncbi:MAG: V-type ATP synthase subunit B [Symbiobacteriaceae bacterium]|nr:V-type ATP synthase subunit B [Symbiobacteriaceae bacterium]